MLDHRYFQRWSSIVSCSRRMYVKQDYDLSFRLLVNLPYLL